MIRCGAVLSTISTLITLHMYKYNLNTSEVKNLKEIEMTVDKSRGITGSDGVQNSNASKKAKAKPEAKQSLQIDMTGGNKNTPQNPLDFIEQISGKKPFEEGSPEMLQFQKINEELSAKYEKMTPEEKAKFDKETEKAFKEHLNEITKDPTVVDRYIEGWKRDFKDVDGVGSALGAVVKRTRDGFKSIDTVNPLTYVKAPVKMAAEKIDGLVSDGDASNLTAGETAWNAAKGAGNVIDYLTSTEGLWVTAATILAAGTGLDAVLSAAPKLAAAAPAANIALGTAGVGLTGKGVYDVATAENEEEAQKGGAEILTGGMMAGGAVLSSKSSLTAARNAGVEAADPATLSTMGAVKENFRVAGEGLKVATGLQAPSMYMKIPATAIRFESKPNKVEAYQTTGKADGIVFEKDGKLFVPNKWNPEAPYEVKDGSIIMIYDKAGGDFAVCDPKIFSKTYVNGDGAYDAMKGIKPGETISATKKAVGGFELVPEGTKVQTLEGEVIVKDGQVVMYDVDGNPYVGDIKNSLFKRNVPVGAEAEKAFKQIEAGKLFTPAPQTVEQGRNVILSKMPDNFKTEASELFDKHGGASRYSYNNEPYVYYRSPYDHMDAHQFFDQSEIIKMDILSKRGINITVSNASYQADWMDGAWVTENGVKTSIIPKVRDYDAVRKFIDAKLAELIK